MQANGLNGMLNMDLRRNNDFPRMIDDKKVDPDKINDKIKKDLGI